MVDTAGLIASLADATAVVIHATPSDRAVVTKTAPHLLARRPPGTAGYLVVDAVALQGRLATNRPTTSARSHRDADFEELAGEIDGLRVLRTPRTPDHIASIGRTFFDDATAPPNCGAGTPVYPFLAGLLAPRTRYVAHYDADMLLHDPGGWLRAGVQLLRSDPRVLFVNPHRGPVATPPAPSAPPDVAGVASTPAMSTRCFLVDVRRLLERTPLPGHRHTWLRRVRYRLEGRSTLRPLEHIFSGLADDGSGQVTSLDADIAFTIHGVHRQYFEDERIDRVIAAIATGDVPPQQRGEENLIGLW